MAEQEKNVTREDVYRAAWNIATVRAGVVERRCQHGALCPVLVKVFGIGSRHAQRLANMLRGWRGRVREEGQGGMVLLIDPARVEDLPGNVILFPQASTVDDELVLKRLYRLARQYTADPVEGYRIFGPVKQLVGKFDLPADLVRSALQRLNERNILVFKVEDGHELVCLRPRDNRRVAPVPEPVSVTPPMVSRQPAARTSTTSRVSVEDLGGLIVRLDRDMAEREKNILALQAELRKEQRFLDGMRETRGLLRRLKLAMQGIQDEVEEINRVILLR